MRRPWTSGILGWVTTPFEPSRRAVYRVVYPERERPFFERGAEHLPILDCSELGIRYLAPVGHGIEPGASVEGTIHFRRGTRVRVSGEVVRAEPNMVALWFGAQGIPLAEMAAERKYMNAADDSTS